MKQSEIKRLLPGIFQRAAQEGSPLYSLLVVMEDLHAPSERALDQLDSYFDPQRAPEGFVPYLAGWVDMDWLLLDEAQHAGAEGHKARPFSPGLHRLRELVASASFLARWRGTAIGLRTFLEIATGAQGFTIEENPPGADGQPRPFHLRILAPAEASVYGEVVRRIIEVEKPAYVTYELQFADNGGNP